MSTVESVLASNDKHKFVAVFKLVMPGQTRATTYDIPVVCESRLEALAIVEPQWEAAVMEYDVEIREVRATGKIREA